MTNRRPKRPLARIASCTERNSLSSWVQRYLDWLEVKNFSPCTVQSNHTGLRVFLSWCEARAVMRPQEVTRPILEAYQRFLFHYRTRTGKPLSFSSQKQRLLPLRAFFKWLTKQNVMLWNPASDLEMPKVPVKLPRAVLSVSEVEAVLSMPDVNSLLGIRDRAILETLYSTGIRRQEIVNLSLYDVEAERGVLMIRQGKGMRDRVVPIGERALKWVDKYLYEVRPRLVTAASEVALFLTVRGERVEPGWLTWATGEYIEAAKLGKAGSCHTFRHTAATLMLEGGADVRMVQEMLGHMKLTSTQVYTRVSIQKLKAVHTATHPGSRLNAPSASEDVSSDAPFSPLAASESAASMTAESLAFEDDDDARDDESE